MEDKAVAVGILAEASKAVDGGRNIHGNVDNSYSMVAQMWEVYLRHSNYSRHNNPSAGHLNIDAADVLEMMSILKKCRFVYATSVNRENFVDDAGYTALAGMLVNQGVPKITHETEDSTVRSLAKALRPRVPTNDL